MKCKFYKCEYFGVIPLTGLASFLFRKMSDRALKSGDYATLLRDPSAEGRFPHLPCVVGAAERHWPICARAIADLRRELSKYEGPGPIHLQNAYCALCTAADAVGRLSVSQARTTRDSAYAAIVAARNTAKPLKGFKAAVLHAANALKAIHSVVADQHDARAPYYRVRDAEQRVRDLEVSLDRLQSAQALLKLNTIQRQIGELVTEWGTARAELVEATRVVETMRAESKARADELAREAELREWLRNAQRLKRLLLPIVRAWQWRRLPVATPVSPPVAVAVEVGEGGIDGLRVAEAMTYTGETYAVEEVPQSTLSAAAAPFVPRAAATAAPAPFVPRAEAAPFVPRAQAPNSPL